MSCKYSDFNGYCQLFDDGIERPCCEADGACVCGDDPNPEDSCEDYEER